MKYEDTLKHIKQKYSLRFIQESPIRIPIDKSRGLSDLFNGLGFRVGAEIGVAKGRFSKWLCIKLRKNKLKLFLVDPYVAYKENIECRTEGYQSILDNAYKEAQERLTRFNVEFIKKTSMEALEDFNDNSLDFVFIDGNHTFEYVVNDIAGWSKKVKPGGIVSGHDYWRSIESRKPSYVENFNITERMKLVQVKDAVNGWTYANRIKPWFITKDLCWFYVKK